MEVSSICLSSLRSTPLKHTLISNLLSNSFLTFPSQTFKTTTIPSFTKPTNPHCSTCSKTLKVSSFLKNKPTPLPNSHRNQFLIASMLSLLYTPLPCIAAETSNKIDLESILVSIDDFFNKNPFFVSGVVFIWLVVIPVAEEYFRKYKFISCLDAFKKLQTDSNVQLLDIRDKKSVAYLGSPNLKILNKSTVQAEFLEGDEDGFVKRVLQNFKDPKNATVCVLDNFDGNSMKVAELLFTKGFKEAYAIRGGLRGKKGWQAIQESLLPPSVHVFPKKAEASKQPELKEETKSTTVDNGRTPLIADNKSEKVENEATDAKASCQQANIGSSRCLSPYPMYPDLKPPSSPTPSKP